MLASTIQTTMKPRHYPALYFAAAVTCIIILAIKSANQGTLSTMVIPRQSIYDIAAATGDTVKYKAIEDHTAYINSAPVQYDAASNDSNPPYYQYFHCIGKGTIEGMADSVYLYRQNLAGSFITVDSLLTLYQQAIAAGRIKPPQSHKQ